MLLIGYLEEKYVVYVKKVSMKVIKILKRINLSLMYCEIL